MKTKSVLAFVAVAMFALVIGQVQATVIEINGDFKMYKPGTNYTVTATFDAGTNASIIGFGDNVTLVDNGTGTVTYGDGTTGKVVDAPGWISPITLPEWRDGGRPDDPPDGIFEDFETDPTQLFTFGTNEAGDGDDDGSGGTSALNCFGEWSDQNGNLAESEPLGYVANGASYTLSGRYNGSVLPVTLELRAGGVAMTPSSSVEPARNANGYAVGWVVISRTYDAEATAPHVDQPITIVLGSTPPHIWSDWDGPDNDYPTDDDELYPDTLLGRRGKFDNIRLEGENLMGPSPKNGEIVKLNENLELSWNNKQPVDGNDVWVDVWFGTDPNELHPGYDMTLVVDAGTNADSVIVDASVEGTYYWKVNSYVYGAAHINDANMIEGALWSFIAVDDVAPTVQIVTVDQATWSGEGVPLDSTVTDDAKSAVTIEWTADDDSLAEANLTIEIINADQADATVTITKTGPTDDVVTVTMTVAVSDEVNTTPDTKTVEIDVYDNACHLARVGEGKSSTTDLNNDCVTGLADLAIAALDWFNDYSSTGPSDR